ncbi:hypothetical protein LEP1GSC195_2249 [Leptospira wolbachii serovar Codice str. CDC]|uniref:Uncharacterized protein n=1 Tax=Leptospira wolbachii serovar Codice str. CDC TaxID=1218599 RepID=R9A5W1_9LEPT|nr:hypothetical protein LEP1GSC195_2249 [Leptospira wolbachii serovar Codice str. CDC]
MREITKGHFGDKTQGIPNKNHTNQNYCPLKKVTEEITNRGVKSL